MKLRKSWRFALASSFVSLLVCVPIKAQEPNPLEQAAPCKLAGERAEETIGGTANGDLYSATLTKLRQTVEEFITKTGPNDESSLHCLNYDGATLLRLGELEAAAKVYRQATEIARRNFGDNDDSTLTLQGNLAVTLTEMGELAEAEKLQNDTLLHRRALENTPKAHKLAITLVNLAMLQSALGNFPQARDLSEKGLTLARRSLSTDDSRWGTILHNYGMVVDQAGSRAEAQQLFEQALTIRLKNSDLAGAVESLASLAASFYDVGRFEEADHRYEEAYRLATQVFPPLHPTRAKIARSYCRDLSSLGKLQQSLAMCDEALRIQDARGEENKVETYLTEINRGVTLGLLSRNQEAIETLQTAVRGLRTYLPAYSPELYEGIRSLGVVLVDSNEVNKGAELLATALKEQQALLGDSHPDVLLTQGNYGVVLAIQGNLREAEAELSIYAKKADQMRQLYGRDQRTVRGVFSRFAATRMFLAKLLVQEGRCREAFDWMEETKSRQLRDDIREHAEVGIASAEDRNLFASLEQAKTRLFLERARNAGNGAKQTEIDVRLHELDERAGEIVARVQKRSASSVENESPSTAVLNEHLRTGSTIGSFALVEQEVLVASYNASEGFHCTSLAEWAALYDSVWTTHAVQSSVRGIPGLLTGAPLTPASRVVRTGTRSFALIPRAAPIPEGATIVTSADDVLNVVGQELLSWLVGRSTDRLIISPDGVLGLIAFDALKIDGKFLVNRLSVSEVDSFAQSPVTTRAAGQSRSQTEMIAFGDPIYAASDFPSTAAEAANKASAIVRGDNDETVNWAPLPASAIELRSLSSLYNLIPSKTLFSKEAANVQTLRDLARKGVLKNTRFLIFSAHAFANASDPELSSVVLSVPRGGSARDAYLTAVEIASLNLNSDLVFFSACDTGFGQVVTGEGVLSLSSAALVAGSRSTIHTLWSVVDSTSAEFTKQFFTSMRNGLSPEQALTKTKRSFANKTENASPAFWAPYTLLQSSTSSP